MSTTTTESTGSGSGSAQAADVADQADSSAVRHADGELLQLVTFMVADEEFAIPILSVQEINRMMTITRVPQSPAFIEGVINLRGKIIPVMDLRKRFGVEPSTEESDSRIVVVEVANRVIGFIVDRVNEVLRIDSGIIDPPPSMVSGVDSEYVDGVGKLDDRLLILLNLDRLFSDTDLEQMDRTSAAKSEAD